MTPRLKIASAVIDRLASVKKPSTGCLFGLMYDSTLLVVGFNNEPNFKDFNTQGSTESSSKNYKAHMHNFPTGIDLCGLITFAEEIGNPETDTAIMKMLEEVDVTDNPLLLVCTLSTVNKSCLQTYFFVHDKLVQATYEVIDANVLWQEFFHIRLRSRLPLVCELESNEIKNALHTLYKKVAAGSVAFCLPNNVYLLGGESEGGLAGLPKDSTVGEMYDLQLDSKVSEMKQKGRKYNSSSAPQYLDVLNVGLLMKPTREPKLEEQPRAAPVIQHIKKSYECLRAYLHIDALSMVPRSAQLTEMYAILVESVCRNLKLTENCILEQVMSAGAGGSDAPAVSLPQPLHFLPAGFSHFLTLALPENQSDNQLESYRVALHTEMGLPMNRPFFRKGNAYLFASEQQSSLLVNPHEGLGPSGVKGGEVSLVQGLYSYHHYMQDRINDNGWGCAYRSLQTLVSWFRWQGYTTRNPPSHQEIQECLVRIGDKPSSFIGSSQWIGSTEVSFCLESMLGVTSRIIAVSSGEELGYRGGELAMHFQTQGTPIMIGGGVLAHTILGVDFNRSTGDLKFLILDPHYTGGEDLAVIQNKGWCGWKGLDFWSKSAYYNLCLPLRPTGI